MLKDKIQTFYELIKANKRVNYIKKIDWKNTLDAFVLIFNEFQNQISIHRNHYDENGEREPLCYVININGNTNITTFK